MTIGKRYVKGWLVCYAFMLAFTLVMVPSLAYADTYVATEDSAVRAAMVYLGYDPDEGESTNKLVTAFYDATSGEDYTGWQSFVNGLYQPLDTVNYNEQWWSPADGFMFSAQVDRARTDAAKIYAQWEKSSSSSSQPNLTVPFPSSVTLYGVHGYYGVGNVNTNEYPDVTGKPMTLYISNVSTLNGWLDPNKKHLIVYLPYRYTSVSWLVYVFESSTDMTVSYVDKFQPNTTDWRHVDFTVDGCEYAYRFEATRNDSNLDSLTVTINGSIYNRETCNGQRKFTDYYFYLFDSNVPSGSGTTPEPEPEPEPEPPTPPEPPRDPEPPTPDPTQPSQTIDLQGIIDRLDIIIRNQVVLINWLDDAFASVTANIQWLGELIDESFGWLWEVLNTLQSSIDSGINRITTWLEMIYNRIGGQGGTVSRPQIDTPTPWDDFLSWLEGILQRLLDLIFGVTPSALQNLLSGLADLTTKFPFSIPWDLAALVALFAHAPVTPVIDFPLMVPFMNAPLLLHVDCTQWDGLAAICRDGETVIFAAWLVLKTPDLYRHLGNVSGAD